MAEKSSDSRKYRIDELEPGINRFIRLANELVEEGEDTEKVAAALMTASGVYSTYVAAGNNGHLQSKGVKKLAGVYEQVVKQVQEWKKRGAVQN